MRLQISNIKLSIKHSESDLYAAVSKKLRVNPKDIKDISIRHKSIDARRKPDVFFIYSVEADVREGNRILNNKRITDVTKSQPKEYVLPIQRTYTGRPIIVGAGPAGLFCAYVLILAGLSPIIFERGKTVRERKEDVEKFWQTGILDTQSNVQFGEGGAGTFSDGKLNTLVKDHKGRCRFVMETFVKFGAPANILYDAKPHVGTDILISVVENMREYIAQNGGEFHFESQVTDFLSHNGHISGVVVNDTDEYYSDRVVLAVGHSARDTFNMLDLRDVDMSAKAFAVGLRIEHPRKFINYSQYGYEELKELGSAPYKLTYKADNGRGVYSFCMCPGGYVVNASSEEKMIAVNGMSYSGRNGNNSNTAIVVTVNPQDFGDESKLSGMHFQRKLEAKAFDLGAGAVPVQRFGDFAKACLVNGKIDDQVNCTMLSDRYPEYKPCIKGAYKEADLHTLFNNDINLSIIQGMNSFGRSISDYNAYDAFLSGVESRTSSPVRIWRDDYGVSTSLAGLYPCGEGAGYAGGITSAGMDGIYIAEQIIVS